MTTTAPSATAWTPLYREHLAALQTEYDRVLSAAGWDGVVIHSGTPRTKSTYDDQYWPLRVTPHFQHWLPLAEADCALLILPGRDPSLYRNRELSFWEGRPSPEGDHFWNSFEVIDIDHPDRVRALLPANKRLAVLSEFPERAAAWGFSEQQRNPGDLHRQLDELRSNKSAYERSCISEANRRAAAGHKAVIRAFRTGDHSELQLHLKYLEATDQDDAETPYKNIVALGEHAAVLHHVHYGRTATAGAHSLLLDAGATCLGYHSDITRTSLKGNSTAADIFGQLITEVDTLQQELCSRVRPGIPYEQLHNECHELVATALRAVGIATASAQELVTSGATRSFLPHGLGHSLGLQTHDVGCAAVKPAQNNPFLRNTSTIAAGQVFTIEPGIYFIEPLLAKLRSQPVGSGLNWPLVAELQQFGGIRIEDNLAVREQGFDNLTREHLPQ